MTKKTLIDMLSDADLFKSMADVEFACLATGADSKIQGFGDFIDYAVLLREGNLSCHLMVKNKLLRPLEKEDLDKLVAYNKKINGNLERSIDVVKKYKNSNHIVTQSSGLNALALSQRYSNL